MIQAPQSYGMQPASQAPARKPAFAPSYNAVQINLDTPTLNAPPAMPYYPPVNMEPYKPQAPAPAPAPAQPEAPAQAPAQPTQVPPPVLDTTQPQQPQVQQPTEQPKVDVKPETNQGPQNVAEEAFKGLSSPDYDVQALAMEDIAKKGLNNQEDVIPYVQENIFDKLIDIMNVDSTKLAGPTDKQLEIRDKMAQNDKAVEDAVKAGQDPKTAKLPFALTPQEEEEGNKLSPMEQAERNKEYAMFTTAILQKTYADEIEKQSGTVVPLSDLPGAKAIITTLKTSDNPDMAASAIDALRYVQRPEYKPELTTLYTIAQNDSRQQVADAATEALASLNAPQEGQTAKTIEMQPNAQNAVNQAA